MLRWFTKRIIFPLNLNDLINLCFFFWVIINLCFMTAFSHAHQIFVENLLLSANTNLTPSNVWAGVLSLLTFAIPCCCYIAASSTWIFASVRIIEGMGWWILVIWWRNKFVNKYSISQWCGQILNIKCERIDFKHLYQSTSLGGLTRT